jgi:hypothetical protein
MKKILFVLLILTLSSIGFAQSLESILRASVWETSDHSHGSFSYLAHYLFKSREDLNKMHRTDLVAKCDEIRASGILIVSLVTRFNNPSFEYNDCNYFYIINGKKLSILEEGRWADYVLNSKSKNKLTFVNLEKLSWTSSGLPKIRLTAISKK